MVTDSDDMKDMWLKSIVVVAVRGLEKPTANFEVRAKPEQRVFVLEDVCKNKMVMCPFTTQLKIDDEKKGHEFEAVVTYEDAGIRKSRSVMLVSCTSKKSMSEFWMLRTVGEKTSANMELSSRRVVLAMTPFVTVVFPCLMNKRPVEKYEELVRFKAVPAKDESKSRVVPLTLEEPTAKKPRS